MRTEALLRKTVHPPCPDEQEILEITVPADRTHLSLSDRLSLRIGLWLLLRAERIRSRTGSANHEKVMRLRARPLITEHEALTLLTYDLQRQLR